MPKTSVPGRPGDWLEVVAPGRGPRHRGQIVEVLGGPGHEHYRVRWTDDHESIHYPADGTTIAPSGADESGPAAAR